MEALELRANQSPPPPPPALYLVPCKPGPLPQELRKQLQLRRQFLQIPRLQLLLRQKVAVTHPGIHVRQQAACSGLCAAQLAVGEQPLSLRLALALRECDRGSDPQAMDVHP